MTPKGGAAWPDATEGHMSDRTKKGHFRDLLFRTFTFHVTKIIVVLT